MKGVAFLLPTYNDQDSIQGPNSSFTVVVVDGASVKPPVIDFEKYPFTIKLIIQKKH